MYVGVDVGGTKTFVAVLDDNGVIKEQAKFPTPKSYDNFLLELRHIAAHLKHKDFKGGGAGIPTSRFDRHTGRALQFGNLPWKNVAVQHDLERIFDTPFVVENDAKVAALSESMLLKDKYHKVTYVTLSTGIGYGLAADGKIDPNVGDGGGRTILLEHEGKLMSWEDFASGRAIVERYGKKAGDITDKATWQKIARELAQGFVHLIAIMQPDVIVIGGAVGAYFERYGKFLEEEIEKYKIPSVKLPAFRQAQRPEEAVVFGCYDLAKQVFGHEEAAR